MPASSIVFGVLLMILGIGTYLGAPVGHQSRTALIPAIFGALLVVFGAIATKPGLRKHAMHANAMVALIGTIAALGRAISKIVAGNTVGLAISAQLTMGILCLIFLVLCVFSFINARKARRAAAQE